MFTGTIDYDSHVMESAVPFSEQFDTALLQR